MSARPLKASALTLSLFGPAKATRTLRSTTQRLFSVCGSVFDQCSFVLIHLGTDCSGDSQAGFKWLKKAGYEFPQSARLEYDQKLYYVTVTFSISEDMRKRIDKILVDGGQEGFDHIGWLYTFVPHYNICNEGFVLGKMDNDTSTLPPLLFGRSPAHEMS